MNPEIIHQFVPGAGSATTVLLLHGTGGDEHDLIPIARGLAPGSALLSPRGQMTENGMARFFRKGNDGAFDEDDVRARAAELEQFVSDAAVHYGFDPARVAALGYSNGANMAAALLLLYPRLLSAAVLLRATLPLAPEPLLPIAGVPVLILAGAHDAVLPAPGTERLARTLSHAGALVEVRWGDSGHELDPEDFTAARAFFQVLG